MEGVAGICRWDQVVAGKPGYEEGRILYTEELNAAVRGAFAARRDRRRGDGLPRRGRRPLVQQPRSPTCSTRGPSSWCRRAGPSTPASSSRAATPPCSSASTRWPAPSAACSRTPCQLDELARAVLQRRRGRRGRHQRRAVRHLGHARRARHRRRRGLRGVGGAARPRAADARGQDRARPLQRPPPSPPPAPARRSSRRRRAALQRPAGRAGLRPRRALHDHGGAQHLRPGRSVPQS